MVWQVLDWNEPAINFYKKYPDVGMDNSWINCSINPFLRKKIKPSGSTVNFQTLFYLFNHYIHLK
ncbi:MAG: hypothetical protein V9E88_06390 [Ferruginibacter sp.]